MCIVFSIIERVYWYLRVILSSMFVVESSYVSFLRSSFLCVHFVMFLWEWDEWPSPSGSGSLSFPSLHWCDFTPCLIWVDHTFLHIFIVSLSSSSLLVIHLIRFTSLFFSYTDLFQVWYFSRIILAYLIINLICLIVSLLILYSHWHP